MTQSRFFQVSLFFPFVLWCFFLILFSVVYKQGARFILDNLHTVYRVFVPYFVFAAVLWKLAGRRSYRSLLLLASVTPIAWGLFFVFFYILMTVLRRETMEPLHILGIMAFWATVVGYILEIIPLLILNIFKDAFRELSEGPKSLHPEHASGGAAGSAT